MTLTLTRVPCPAAAVDSLEEGRSRSPLNEPRSICAGSDQPDSGSIPPMLYNDDVRSRIRRDDLVGSLLQNDFRVDFKMLVTNTDQEDWLKELELCVNGEVHSYSPWAALPSILTGEACLAAAGSSVLKTFEFIKTPLLQAELGSRSPEINGPSHDAIGCRVLGQDGGLRPLSTEIGSPAIRSLRNRFTNVHKPMSLLPCTGTPSGPCIPLGLHFVGLLSNRESNKPTMREAAGGEARVWRWPGQVIMREPVLERRLFVVTSLRRDTANPSLAGDGNRVMTGHPAVTYSSIQSSYWSSQMVT